MTSAVALSVVMPAYNEEASVDMAIAEIVEHVFGVVEAVELVVVDDGSRDRTAERVGDWARRDPRIRLVQRPNGGHGAAIMTGIANSGGRRLLLVDSDAQVGLESFRQTWETAAGADAVFGVRRPRRDPAHRLLLTRLLRSLLRRRYGVPYADANVPYKLVDRAWCERLASLAPSSPRIPSILLALVLSRARATVVEQLVTHRPRRGGTGSLKPLRLARFCVAAWRELDGVSRALSASRS